MSDYPDLDRKAREYRSRELRAWRRYGPVLYRFRQMFFLAVSIVVACALLLLYLTLDTLYPGTGSFRPYGPTERPVHVTAEECRRVGPVSDQGLGYWWACRITFQREGGQVAEAVVGGSIVRPEEIGTAVTLYAACDEPDGTDCRFGKPVSGVLALLYGVFRIFGTALGIALVATVFFYLFRVLVGAPTYFRLVDKSKGRKGKC